jgi:hypothetical protein
MSSSDSRDRHSSVESWPHSLSPLSLTHTRDQSRFSPVVEIKQKLVKHNNNNKWDYAHLENDLSFVRRMNVFYDLFHRTITNHRLFATETRVPHVLGPNATEGPTVETPGGRIENLTKWAEPRNLNTHTQLFSLFWFLFSLWRLFFFLNWNEKTKNLVFMQITLHVYWSFIRPPFIILSTEIDTHGKLPATRAAGTHGLLIRPYIIIYCICTCVNTYISFITFFTDCFEL